MGSRESRKPSHPRLVYVIVTSRAEVLPKAPSTDLLSPTEGPHHVRGQGVVTSWGTPGTSPSALGSEMFREAGLHREAPLPTLESGGPGSRCPPSCHCLQVRPWADTLTSPSPSFALCKMRISPLPLKAVPFPSWGARSGPCGLYRAPDPASPGAFTHPSPLQP